MQVQLPAYAFFDIMEDDKLRVMGRTFVENATAIYLLKLLCKGLRNADGKLNVAIVYLCSSRLDSAGILLASRFGSHNKINLEVNSLDKLQKTWYDVVVLLVCDDTSKLLETNMMNTTLTMARSFLWIVGDASVLLASGGSWKDLVNNAKERKCLGKMNSNLLADVMKSLNVNDPNISTAATTALLENIMQLLAQEFTWEGRPNNSKDILDSLRDQKNARDTCTFQATLGTIISLNKFQCSCWEPPQDYPYDLCLNDAKSKYEKTIQKEFLSEEISKRGKHRLETQLDIARDQGILGRNKSKPEEPERLVKIKSHERVDGKEAEEIGSLLECGDIMIGTFRLSRNYFRLRPGEPYVYQKNIPYIHPKSGLPVSHSAMVVGHGKQPSPLESTSTEPPRLHHVNIQNSEGKRFGVNGFGRVTRGSLRGLYRITLPSLTDQISRLNMLMQSKL
ncbi:hypothetical protein EJB05_57389, partial [Eragrostis curvula]